MDGFWSSWSQLSCLPLLSVCFCNFLLKNIGAKTVHKMLVKLTTDGGKFCDGDNSETIACKIADCPGKYCKLVEMFQNTSEC